MSSNKNLSLSKMPKTNINKELYKLTRKMLYKKYTYGNFSFKKIFTDYLIFNYKCRLTLFFKEFLLSDNECEFLRSFYSKEDIKNILSKILEIYCLYSKIYPNYIILKENKFLYKNIRKKQKMIDENNKNEDMKKKRAETINDNVINKDNELFTLSVRNEIREFQENSFSKKNKNDSSSNRILNSISTKKINDNWVFISNKNLSQNLCNSKKCNNNYIKNMSFDSFWTNDTNNLSILLNAINDKILLDDMNKNNNNNKLKKKKDFNYRNINHKFLKNKNQKRKEIKSSSKKAFKKVIYKKIENKKILSDNSRNNNFLKNQNRQTFYNNTNITKPLSSSLSNSTNYNQGFNNNKPNNLFNHLLTEKNIDNEIKKNIHQYYSIQRECSDKNLSNNLKKIIPPINMKKNLYSKEINKKNKSSSIKKKSENNLKNMNNKCSKYMKKKSQPQEYLKIILDNTKYNYFNEKSIKEENVKNGSFNSRILYSTNNNLNILRNKKYFMKKYFTNNNLIQNKINQRYVNNLTESNSQTLIIPKKEKELNSSNNNYKNKDVNVKTINNCHTTANYYIIKNKNLNSYINEKNFNDIKKQNTEGTVLAARDKILRGGLSKAYIKKKCFSPLSNNIIRRFTLSKSCNIKDEKKITNDKNKKLIQRQMINSEIKNKLTDIRKNIRKQIIQQDNNIYENTYYNNKFINNMSNSNNNMFIMDSSQKENKNNIIKLNNNENIRNNKNVYLRKNFSPTLTYYNLYKSNKIDLSQQQNNYSNNSGLTDLPQEYIVINNNKNKNIYYNKLNFNKLENKENILHINEQKIPNIKEKYIMIKSKTEYENFQCKRNEINKNNKQNFDINKNFILQRLIKRPTNYHRFSKDKINNTINNNSNSNNNYHTNKSELVFHRFNNLSNSTIYNNSNNNEFNNPKNYNNSLSNSLNNISDNQTPLIPKKRFKLIKKFIYHEQKEKKEPFYVNNNISSKITIKVNRSKFLERVKERMKNKNNFNQI